jgi:hypothetical protein
MCITMKKDVKSLFAKTQWIVSVGTAHNALSTALLELFDGVGTVWALFFKIMLWKEV